LLCLPIAAPDFLLDLTPSDLKLIFEKVKEVNFCFFSDSASGRSAGRVSRPGNGNGEGELIRACCRLITSGHGSGVWDYGLSFFKLALKALDESDMDKMRQISLAVRAAGADEKHWKEWLGLTTPA